jgi:hypothetical protein
MHFSVLAEKTKKQIFSYELKMVEMVNKNEAKLEISMGFLST